MRFVAVIALLGTVSAQGIARADRQEELPKELEGVGITEKLSAQVPLDAVFRTSKGAQVKLGDVLAADKPTILTLNYSNCPMLCSMQLNGFVAALRDLKYTAGKEFSLVTISLDSNESPERAAETRARYLKDYGRDAADWTFLVGDETAVRSVADAAGFGFKWVESRQEFAHSPALIVLSPTGTVSRYIYGVMYEANTLRLALVEASEGKTFSPIDKLILYCFHYDAAAGKYAPHARNIMRLGGAATVVTMAGVFIGMGVRSRRRDSGQA